MALQSPCLRSHPAHVSGMFLAAAAFALLTCVDTIFKLVAAGHPIYQILLVNGCFAIIPIIGWAMLSGGFARLHTERPGLHFARGAISLLSASCAIYAYSRLPLSDFYAIVFSGPLIVTLLAVSCLGEKIEPARWLAVLCGFAGVLIVTHMFVGQDEAAAAGRVAALASVICYAASVIMVRRMRIGESNLTFSLYGYFAGIALCGALLLLLGGPALALADISHLMVSGILAGTSSIFLMTAYHKSPVAVIAPFQYTQIIWGVLAGWILWGQTPDREMLLGAAIIAGSGLYVIFRELRPRSLGRAQEV